MVGKWSGIVREFFGNCSAQFRVKPVIKFLTFPWRREIVSVYPQLVKF